MEIEQIPLGAGTLRRPPVDNGPIAEVLLGGAEQDRPVGLVNVTVPAGGRMPEHDHGSSTVVLIPLAGTMELIDADDGGRVREVAPGTVTVIPVGRRVALANPGSDDGRMLVVVTPPDFTRHITAWPAAAEAVA